MNEHSLTFVLSVDLGYGQQLRIETKMRTRDENKEQTIRQKAIQMIVKEGLDGFSMQKLAKAAKVSPATLYIYYKDRDDLIMRISMDVTNDLLEFSIKGFDPEMNFEEGMKVQWKNRAEYFLKHPVEMEFVEQIRYSPMYYRLSGSVRKNFKDAMGKFVHNAIKKGELSKLPFEIYWSVAFAPLYQLIKFHTQGRSYVNENFTLNDKLMMQTLKIVLKGLKP
jgi:AcrR family transcriptional regulator